MLQEIMEEITVFENEIYSVSYRNIEVYRNHSWHDKVLEFVFQKMTFLSTFQSR